MRTFALVMALTAMTAPAWAQWGPYEAPYQQQAPYPYAQPPGASPWESPGWQQPPPGPRANPDEVARMIEHQSSGAQAGTLLDVFGSELVLRPFDPRAGVARLALPRSAPAIAGGEVLPVSGLRPGTRVKVYYRNQPHGERPIVVGVEVL